MRTALPLGTESIDGTSLFQSVPAYRSATSVLQLNGETIAIYAIATAAVLALVFFVVKFAAGFREYRQVKRMDSEERDDLDDDGADREE